MTPSCIASELWATARPGHACFSARVGCWEACRMKPSSWRSRKAGRLAQETLLQQYKVAVAACTAAWLWSQAAAQDLRFSTRPPLPTH